ncbi:MAG: hypothetical protein ABIR68_01670, partial [Ilumatobacteraceae bacterium]
GGYQYANFADRVALDQPDTGAASVAVPTPRAVTTPVSTVSPITPAAGDPTSYPVIDQPPTGLTATGSVLRTSTEQQWSEMLVGRIVNGITTDAVVLSVQTDPWSISPMVGSPPTTIDLWGQTASVYDYGTIGHSRLVHVTWGTGPYYLASGADPVAFLSAADPSVAQVQAAAQADQAPTLNGQSLPIGYEVLVPAQQVGQGALSGTLSIGQDNFDVSVSSRNYVVMMALAGPLRSVDIAGKPGWAFESSTATQDITWQIDQSTFAYLKVNDGTGFDGALAVATKLNFVDWTTFANRYGIATPQAPPASSAPSHPTSARTTQSSRRVPLPPDDPSTGRIP